jgi:hypothetical protein
LHPRQLGFAGSVENHLRDRERKERRVEERVDKGQVEAHEEDDGLSEHEDERAGQSRLERLGKRDVLELMLGHVGGGVVVLVEALGFALEKHRREGLGHDEGETENDTAEAKEGSMSAGQWRMTRRNSLT